MKYAVLLLMSLFVAAGDGQDVTNTKTPKYVAIANTHISMLSPGEKFQLAPDGSGFIHNSEVQIKVMELGIPWQMMGAEFLAEAQKNPKTSRVFKLNGRDATLVFSKFKSPTGASLTMRTLAFGDDQTTVTINGYYPETKAAEFAKAIETSLLSVVVEEKMHPAKEGAPKGMMPMPTAH